VREKFEMAQIMEQFIFSGDLELIQDQRQTQQIISVNNELKAPETPMGHGEAFWSVGLALRAVHESHIFGYESLGSISSWVDAIDPKEEDDGTDQSLTNIRKLVYDKPKPENIPLEKRLDVAPNPKCTEVFCTPEMWVKERNLCLYCGIRG